MGCFSSTCMLSGLPIGVGTPIRLLALKDKSVEKKPTCNADSLYEPICPGLKGSYNDYGSIENLEEGVVTENFFNTLNQLAYERGVGDNQCHDVAVEKGMSRDRWLEALWEVRIKVPRFGNPRPTNPYISPLEKAVRECVGSGLFLIDRPCSGLVRVRLDKFEAGGVSSDLEAVQKILSTRFAVMQTTGSGGYNYAELLVGQLPGEVLESTSLGADPFAKEVTLHQVMIREDVWDLYLNLETGYDMEYFMVEAAKPFPFSLYQEENTQTQEFLSRRIPEYQPPPEMLPKQPELIRALAELHRVQSVMVALGVIWQQGHQNTPQSPEWAPYVEYYEKMQTLVSHWSQFDPERI